MEGELQLLGALGAMGQVAMSYSEHQELWGRQCRSYWGHQGKLH